MNTPETNQLPPDPAASAGPNCAPVTGSAEWAVSVVLVRHKPDGGLNVMNELQRVRATSRDEATAAAIRVSMARLPEHLVHCTTILQISEPNSVDEPRGANIP